MPTGPSRVGFERIWHLIDLAAGREVGARARLSPPAEATLARAGAGAEARSDAVQAAMLLELPVAFERWARLPGGSVSALEQLGAHGLLVEVAEVGRLRRRDVERVLERARRRLPEIGPEAIKNGLLAFDAALRGLSAVESERLQTPVGTAARDSLLVFARALHR